MLISVGELKEITDKRLSHLAELNIESIEISQDYYWNIPSDKLYDPYKQPEELSIGQLTENWQELKKVLSQKDPIGYNFIWLATIFRAIGEKVVL